MKDTVEQFIKLERRIAKDKGEFFLFALFLREDAPDKWDLVVAAPWMDADRTKALSYLAEQIKEELKPRELTQLSRVVIVDQQHPSLAAIKRAVKKADDIAEVANLNFFGLQIKHGYIIVPRHSRPSAVKLPRAVSLAQ